MRIIVTLLSNVMSIIAGAILLVMTGLTFLDIVMRYLGRPLLGAYELVAFLGVSVAAFSLPRASLKKAHVYVDFVLVSMTRKRRKVLQVCTRILVFFMFFFAAWYFLLMARNFIETHTVTMTLRVPFYPVVYALAAGSIAQCLVSLYEIFWDKGDGDE